MYATKTAYNGRLECLLWGVTSVNGKIAMPFGRAVSPYYFVKCIRQVIKYLRASNIQVTSYVDDFLLSASPLCIVHDKEFVLHTFDLASR